MIGVVVPTHNRPGLIVEALDSLRAQTYPHWLAFVVDDASETDYAAVHRRYANEKRIVFFRLEENGGVNAARNHAIDMAQDRRVDYITFLDDDDAFAKDYFEVAREMISRHPGYEWFWSNTYGDTKPVSQRIQSTKEYDYINDRVYGPMRGDKAKMISSRAIGDARFNLANRTEDRHFFVDVTNRTKILGFCHDSKKITYHQGGFTRTKSYPRNMYDIVYKFSRHWYVIRSRPFKAIAYRYLLLELSKTPQRVIRMWWMKAMRAM